MNQKTDVYELMAKCIFGEATIAETADLQELLKNNADLQKEYTLIYEILRIKKQTSIPTGIEQESALSIIEKAAIIKRKHDFTNRKKLILLSAAAAIALMIGLFLWLNPQNKTLPIARLSSPIKIIDQAQNSERKKLKLKDGSIVWLNSGTQLFYSNDFEGATREVTLKGEAFFDVTKQHDKPFIVHTDAIDIHVLGTSFNVKAYEDEDHIETTLYEGAVNVTYKNSQSLNPIKLIPHQKLIIKKEILPVATIKNSNKTVKESFVIEKIDSSLTEKQTIETAWKYNRLEFNDEPLMDIAKKMERWYNVKIVIEDDALKQLRFYGSFKDETLDQALQALQIAYSFKYKTINTHEVHISK